MSDLTAIKARNAQRWLAAKIARDATAPARRLVAAKPRYHAVEAKTGVPWIAIAVIHEREASQRWDTQLGQGDPLNRASVHVPAGRGPFATWEEGAYDALVNCAPHGARWSDWSIGGLLTLLEQYNGLGYAKRGIASPYIWAGTDQYVSGKYVADGVFDPAEVDKQIGCAALLLAMAKLDASITFTGVTTAAPTPPGATAPVHDGAWLQASLNKLGASPQLVVDGFVGPSTRNAVRAFQLASNLVVDGLVGPATFAALDAALLAGKALPTLPVPPEITLPAPGTQARTDLAPTFWGRVFDLFKPKGN